MHKLLILFLSLSSGWVQSQSLSPEVIATAGEHFATANAQLSWTLGEPVIETYAPGGNPKGYHLPGFPMGEPVGETYAPGGGTFQLTQGFHLPAWKALPSPLDSLLKVTMNVIYASPVDNNTAVKWGPHTNITALSNIQSANMDFAGETNTAAIVAQLGDNGGRAYPAKVCADLVAYGFDDWYLPAAGELNEMYEKLGPVANGGSGQITSGLYWSSSEINNDRAWIHDFDNGGQYYDFKHSFNRCRCVRR